MVRACLARFAHSFKQLLHIRNSDGIGIIVTKTEKFSTIGIKIGKKSLIITCFLGLLFSSITVYLQCKVT